ncbi:MAG: putative reverse transcriptase, partial [Streblomastix strix]
MEEILQPQPNMGMGRKQFVIQRRGNCEKKLQEKLRICPFSGSREEEIAYTEKLEEELCENITEEIHPEQAKWFNPTFIIPKLHLKWRKILDASALNKEIQTIHFKMNGTDHMRDLIRKGDWATSLDLKSAFHHLIVYPPHRKCLALEAMGKVDQYRAMPFGTQHSPIFFAQALAMVLTKMRRESDIRILNYVDDLLLLHQNKERLRKKT